MSASHARKARPLPGLTSDAFYFAMVAFVTILRKEKKLDLATKSQLLSATHAAFSKNLRDPQAEINFRRCCYVLLQQHFSEKYINYCLLSTHDDDVPRVTFIQCEIFYAEMARDILSSHLPLEFSARHALTNATLAAHAPPELKAILNQPNKYFLAIKPAVANAAPCLTDAKFDTKDIDPKSAKSEASPITAITETTSARPYYSPR